VWTGLVLAGGRSERMGRDKTRIVLEGRTLLERAVTTVRAAGGAPLVLGTRRETGGLEGARFEDEAAAGRGRIGPLNAIGHGLAVAGTPIVVSLACDLPLVPAGFLRFLAAEASRWAAVVPRAAGEMQVLAAAYTVACLEAIDRRLAAGERSVHGFLQDVQARILEGDELSPFGGEDIFLNVNTPEDLARAETILRGRSV
jgi:molybdopterin-guanine dinucleotide biosynthesis protein A